MLVLRARVLALEAVLHTLVRELARHDPWRGSAAFAHSRETARDLILRVGPPPHRVHTPEGIVDVALDLADVVFKPPPSIPPAWAKRGLRPTPRGIAWSDDRSANDR